MVKAAAIIDEIGNECHRIAKDHGFWRLDENGQAILHSRNFGEMIALMHSELSEALEHHRKGTCNDHLPQYEGWAVEFADVIVRVLETARAYQIPIGQIILDKMDYNRQREYKHGKMY